MWLKLARGNLQHSHSHHQEPVHLSHVWKIYSNPLCVHVEESFTVVGTNKNWGRGICKFLCCYCELNEHLHDSWCRVILGVWKFNVQKWLKLIYVCVFACFFFFFFVSCFVYIRLWQWCLRQKSYFTFWHLPLTQFYNRGFIIWQSLFLDMRHEKYKNHAFTYIFLSSWKKMPNNL